MPAIDPAMLERTATLLRERPARRGAGRAADRRARVRIENHLGHGDGARSLARDVLTRPRRELPPKHFYDARGMELFDRICELPEYYPCRVERAILERDAATIVRAAGARELLELGCGSATKTVLLLDAMEAAGLLARYVPVDVCAEVVRGSSASVADAYSGLAVHGVVGDFERHLARVPAPRGRRLVAFLGSTLGNLRPPQRRRFLRAVGGLLGGDGRLLAGVDLVKDPELIRRAYDDAEGVTAEFNRNVLRVINRELGGDFRPELFDHVAVWDPRREWVEMRLRSRVRQRVSIERLRLVVELAAGEEIRTEISAKFTRERLAADLAAAGLAIDGWHTDDDGTYALAVAAPEGR